MTHPAALQALLTPETAAQTLQAWQARDAELRERNHQVGLGRPEQFIHRSGIEAFRAMLAGDMPRAPISNTLDFILVEADVGHVAFQGRPQFAHYNPLGTVHGGWIATLLDSAVACSVHTSLPAGKTYTTLELKINYVRALTDKVPLVRAIAQVIHVGGRTATAEGRLVGPDGKLYAHASTTCLVMDLNGQG